MAEYQVTKKQHYVMQNYLKRWKSERKNMSDCVWVKQVSNGSVSCVTSLKKIAQEWYFYELNLDKDTYGLLLYRYKNLPECRSALDFLSVLIKVDEYKKEKLPNFQELHKINKNVLEDEYSRIENFLAIILSAIDSDINQFSQDLIDGKYSVKDLVFLFILQSFRTRQLRDILSREMKAIFLENKEERKELNKEQRENYIKASSYLDSISTTNKIINSGFTVELLVNKNKKLFLTSDAPAIITKYDSNHLNPNAAYLEGYMPLTPNIAMIIRGYQSFKKRLVVREVTQQDVLSWNKIMKKSGCSQLYSKTKFLI